AVNRKRYDRKLGSAQVRLQSIERRHLFPAGYAPSGPDVENNDLSVEIGQAAFLSLTILETDRRGRFRRSMHDEVLQRLFRGHELRARCNKQRCNHAGDSAVLAGRWCHCCRSPLISGRIVSSRACAVSGPICLWAMRPAFVITKVSGTPYTPQSIATRPLRSAPVRV